MARTCAAPATIAAPSGPEGSTRGSAARSSWPVLARAVSDAEPASLFWSGLLSVEGGRLGKKIDLVVDLCQRQGAADGGERDTTPQITDHGQQPVLTSWLSNISLDARSVLGDHHVLLQRF